MSKLSLLISLGAAVAIATLWVLNCSGPRPVVSEVQVLPPAEPGQPYRVQAVVRNTGRGPGQVDVTFRLRDPASGRAYQEERKTRLERGERAQVVAEIPAPPGDYRPEVEAEYPPR